MTIFNLGTRVVNNYLISSEAGWILIDTGYAGGFPHFIKQLRKHGIDPKEIRYVFLTHAHDDHAGFLNEVLEVTEAEVILHPKAIEGLKRGQNSFKGGCSSRVAWLFCQVLALFGHGDHRYPVIHSMYLDRLIPIDSEGFIASHFPYVVLETLGHTADHIALLAEDVLFCGDAAMNGFPSCRRTINWIEDLDQYRQSWKKDNQCEASNTISRSREAISNGGFEVAQFGRDTPVSVEALFGMKKESMIMSRIKDLQKKVYHVLEKNIDDADKRAKAVTHLHGVALAAAILAKKRGENAELATMQSCARSSGCQNDSMEMLP